MVCSNSQSAHMKPIFFKQIIMVTFSSIFQASLRLIFSSFVFIIILLISLQAVAETDKADYELSVSFSPQEQLLTGTAKISIAANEKLGLSLQTLEITGTLLQDEAGSEFELTPSGDILILPAASKKRVLYLSYKKYVRNETSNLVSDKGIALTHSWYPVPMSKKIFKITADLPQGFEAIVESDSFPLQKMGNIVSSFYSEPSISLHFVAGPYGIKKEKVRDDFYVYTMFFEEDESLAGDYLKQAVHFLTKYENQLGEFPYNHYVIVANRQPTGYGIPTFTLLGQAVLRLPFISTTSLGHEIVHSWFGNSVSVDYSEGNWCEGLTSFLSDYHFREEKGEGVESRKESIVKYLSYVNRDNSIALKDFVSASHSQSMAIARRAVGYNRGALFFHELHQLIGPDNFNKSIRTFFTHFQGKSAAWSDIENVFNTTSMQDLSQFFKERLTRIEIPHLGVEDINVGIEQGTPILQFNVIQKSEEPFSLLLPIEIETMSGAVHVSKKISEKNNTIKISLDDRPLTLTLDPEYSFLRQLDDEEMVPTWSRFLGATDKLVVLEDEEKRKIYQPILDAIGIDPNDIKAQNGVTNQDLIDHSLLFLGENQRPLQSILAAVTGPAKGVNLMVQQNPLETRHVVVTISAESEKQVQLVAHRLRHYGKYSELAFQNGRRLFSKIAPTENGISYELDTLPYGGSVAGLAPFQDVIDKISEKRVIYVGETHTSMADHLLQLRLIKALYKKHPKLSIGMEMFPVSSQKALDNYILSDGEKSEADFLQESGYFNVWRYDYRYFQEIIEFAKSKKIPVVALNLDRKIVSQVFRDGSTDNLDRDIVKELPPDRDLGLGDYAQRLRAMHSVHLSGNHGSGKASGFIQSQGLWDETMAANIVAFLNENKEHKMIVLAGSQHTRKDIGIPPRVARRLDTQQASVLNLYSTNAREKLPEILDYFFLAPPVELPEKPRIGIVLSSVDLDGKPALKISQLSPHGKSKDSGLMVGDILVKAGGLKLSEISDIKIALLDKKAGDRVTVTVKRVINKQEKVIDLEVELSVPPKMSSGHP